MIQGFARKTAAVAIIAGCCGVAMAAGAPKQLTKLMNMNSATAAASSLMQVNPKSLKLKAMKSAALSLGAQRGYVYEMGLMKKQVRANAAYMDKAWDFNTIMRLASKGDSELYLLPPVIQEVKNAISASADNHEIKISGKVYRIIKPARLVISPPNWRDYVLFDRPVSVSKPARAVLPTTPSQQKFWAGWVKQGWAAGEQQASREMSQRFRELGQDFDGMVLYLRLAELGKIKKTLVASHRTWVTNKGNQLDINQKVLSIANPAHFDGNIDDWKVERLDASKNYLHPGELAHVPPEGQSSSAKGSGHE